MGAARTISTLSWSVVVFGRIKIRTQALRIMYMMYYIIIIHLYALLVDTISRIDRLWISSGWVPLTPVRV